MSLDSHYFKALLLEDDPRFGLFANDILICEQSAFDPARKWNVIARERDGYEPGCSVYKTQVRLLEKLRGDINEKLQSDEAERIAQNAFHLHQTSSRWEDLHSADQADYVDFTRWVLEVVERDSQVIRDER